MAKRRWQKSSTDQRSSFLFDSSSPNFPRRFILLVRSFDFHDFLFFFSFLSLLFSHFWSSFRRGVVYSSHARFITATLSRVHRRFQRHPSPPSSPFDFDESRHALYRGFDSIGSRPRNVDQQQWRGAHVPPHFQFHFIKRDCPSQNA